MGKFDLIIIGGGAGAFGAAIRANELKAKTAMVNTGLPLGGTCVNVGCVPSKTLLWAGEILHLGRHHRIPGIELEIKNFDFQKVIRDELNLVARLRREKYENVLTHLPYVSLHEGKATFTSPKTIQVNGTMLEGEKFIIATGSTAAVPPIEGIREVGFLTHIEALQLKTQPKDLAVIGAGPLGLEFAQMYSRFGTNVTILEYGGTIFGPGEPELTLRLKDILEGEGIRIETDARIKNAYREKDGKVLVYGKGDTNIEKSIKAEEILLATGKTPNTKGMGLEKAGVRVNERGAILVNQFFQTSQAHIFAVGDVVSLPLRLETTAGHEGTLAAENALTGSQNSIDYTAVPYTIFTDPQLAGVGYTEEEQTKTLKVCACRTVSFTDIPKAQIMRRTEGLIKMVIHPQTRQIMGVHILAPQGGDLIAQAMILVKNKNTIDDVVNSLPVFPTLSEAIKLAALSFTKDISKLSCCI